MLLLIPLLGRMLDPDPAKRPSAAEILFHQFFADAAAPADRPGLVEVLLDGVQAQQENDTETPIKVQVQRQTRLVRGAQESFVDHTAVLSVLRSCTLEELRPALAVEFKVGCCWLLQHCSSRCARLGIASGRLPHHRVLVRTVFFDIALGINIALSVVFARVLSAIALAHVLLCLSQGEHGVDAGGPTKELLALLMAEVQRPEHGLFVCNHDSAGLWLRCRVWCCCLC
jgi:hypothetical protein